MVAPSATFVLPTEPLLEQPSRDLFRLRLSSDVAEVLDRLHEEIDLEARSAALFRMLRKHLGDPRLVDILSGIVHEAVRAQPRGTATLAALLAVRAPGRTMIDAVREFSHLHRMITRCEFAQARGQRLSSDAKALLGRWREMDMDLVAFLVIDPAERNALPHPLDLGPAGNCRRAFRRLIDKLDADGVLSGSQLKQLGRLADLELRASAMRAEQLAESIDPFSARHVSTVLPLLAVMDTTVRDTRAFLTALEESGRTTMFHERHPLMRDQLDAGEVDQLLSQMKVVPGMHPLYRLAHQLQRNPMPTLRLGYYAHWILWIANVLRRAGLRETAFNIVDAVLLALEFVGDDDLLVPASPQVCNALSRARIGPLRLADGGIHVPFDEFEARALNLPLGLPNLATEAEPAAGEPTHQDVREIVGANIHKISILSGLLKNPKVFSTPGVVLMVVQRCRDLQTLTTICEDRKLHTGVANRDVPPALLRSPMRIPMNSLRRFINVRFVSKVELRRMALDRNTLRREVCDEIELYLKSLV